MTEQGLKAVVYPELDDVGMQKFLKDFSEQLSQTYVNVGINRPNNISLDFAQSGDSSANTSNVANTVINDSAKEAVKEAVKSADKENTESNPNIADTKNKSINMNLGAILGKAGGIASAVGDGAVTVAEALVGIFKFLESTSKPLAQVFDLFQMAFNMIWMPIGTILAIELMPMLRETFYKIGEWMTRAWDIYDKEGWVGLIHSAVSTSVDVLIGILGQPEIWVVMGTVVWELLTRFSLGNILSEWIFGEPAGWTDFRNVIDGFMVIVDFYGDLIDTELKFIQDPLGTIIDLVSRIPDTINGIISFIIDTISGYWNDILLDGLDNIFGSVDSVHSGIETFRTGMNEMLGFIREGLTALYSPLEQIETWADDFKNSQIYKDLQDVITNVSSFFTSTLPDLAGDIWTAFSSIDFVKTVTTAVDTIKNLPENMWGEIKDNLENQQWFKDLKSTLDTIKGFISTIVGKLGGAVEVGSNVASGNLLGAIGAIAKSSPIGELAEKYIPFLADGGIVTQPTMSIVGEEGPEAIVPLNQLSQIANEYSTIKGDSFDAHTNIMNFYINGENAMEVGNEVQRILEKTVGKASSKMMWW